MKIIKTFIKEIGIYLLLVLILFLSYELYENYMERPRLLADGRIAHIGIRKFGPSPWDSIIQCAMVAIVPYVGLLLLRDLINVVKQRLKKLSGKAQEHNT